METNGKIRLIDANALKENLCVYCQSVNPLYALECNGGECSALRIIDDMPTLDCAPVVRCKDCKHYELYDGDYICELDEFCTCENDFCSNAEPKKVNIVKESEEKAMTKEEKSMNTQDFDSFSDSIADKIGNMTVDRCAELIRETMSSLAEADYSLSLTDYSKFSLESFLDAGIINTEFYKWLVNNGFKTAPASTKYHGNIDGGLYRHSCKVTEELVRLTIKLDLEWQRKASPYIVGMFHDICKIDQYEKNEDGYEYNSNTLLTGHGDKSIMLLSQFMTLTEEEMLCIRYHMGAYFKDDWTGYDMAIKKYPNVLYTHTADMLASKLSI